MTTRSVPVGLAVQPDPMSIPYMSRKIILSFNPLIPNSLAPRNRTIHALFQVLHFVVAVQCLLSQKQGSPGATGLAVEVTPPFGRWLRPSIRLLERDSQSQGWGGYEFDGELIHLVIASPLWRKRRWLGRMRRCSSRLGILVIRGSIAEWRSRTGGRAVKGELVLRPSGQ